MHNYMMIVVFSLMLVFNCYQAHDIYTKQKLRRLNHMQAATLYSIISICIVLNSYIVCTNIAKVLGN